MSRADCPVYLKPGEDYYRLNGGLTIREHFAALAMQGIIASNRNSSSVVLDVAAEAREYADAMIDELEREPRK